MRYITYNSYKLIVYNFISKFLQIFSQEGLVSPLIKSHEISTNETQVFLKLDNVQPSGSFKIRGIGYLIEYAKRNGFNKLVSSSGGNKTNFTSNPSIETGIFFRLF